MDNIKSMYNDYIILRKDFTQENLDSFIETYLYRGAASQYNSTILANVPELLKSGKITCDELGKYSNMFFQLQSADLVPFSVILSDGNVSDYKSPCPYGSKCYRKNKDHIRMLFHPREESVWTNGIGTLLGSFCNKGGSKKRKKRENTKKKKKRIIKKRRRYTKRRN